jgi:hypothetical protein
VRVFAVFGLRPENAELRVERDVLRRSVVLRVKDAMGR